MHFRLYDPNAFDYRDGPDCDRAAIEGALADLGHQLNLRLSLVGDVFLGIIEGRSYDVPNFVNSQQWPVYIV